MLQPVWTKKIPETMEGLCGIFLLYTDAEVSLTDPLASGETQRNDLGSQNQAEALERRLLTTKRINSACKIYYISTRICFR